MSNISYPSIPDPNNTLESIGESVRTMKQSVELLTGQRTGVSRGAPRIFVQPATPSTIDIGDLWINTATNKLLYWSGSTWTSLT